MKKILFLLPMIMICGCSKKTTTVAESTSQQPEVVRMVDPIGSRPVSMVLKASAFQMTGDYSNNVAITLNNDGSLAYFPDPSDITSASRPIDLGNGWWLNRQGIGPNSVFTRYTFDEYEKLPNVPTLEELKASVIPGARVSNWKRLSYPASEAMQHLPEIKEELK